MNPLLQTLRAIGAEFARRLYQPVAITASIAIVIVLGLFIWLTTVSVWWWILLGIDIFVSLIIIGVLIAAWFLLRALRPQQSKVQKVNVRRFVDKIQSIADVAGTPKPVILFYIIRDMVTKSSNGYVRRISSETLSMQHDFKDISDSFK